MNLTMRKTFVDLMNEIDLKKHEQRDRGTLFELLVVAYLKNEPLYARLFDEVWKLSEVPLEYNIPKKDTGVDLVARKRETGDLVAIQCKFYSKDTTIQKKHIDSFLNEVGKQFYSEGIIVTSTDKWSSNADDAINFRDKPIIRISLSNLQESKIDWSSYSFNNPKVIKLKEEKTPRPYQIPAIEAVVEGFKSNDRGKLIMAPGTGKTYISMAIAEKMAEEKKDVFRVLYLVPSIQLLSQTLRSWTADTKFNMDSIAVCSDRKVTKVKGNNELEDIAAADLGYPATTDFEKLLEYKVRIDSSNSPADFLTVFSTYQSIDVIIEAQKNGFYDFDLVICDEAHRTTGVTEIGTEGSAFTKVHSDSNIKTSKRLYQTATPRIYGEDTKRKAKDMSILIADMNDPEIYGEEFYRIGFGDAIRKGILTDYKVMVLAVDEEAIARRFQLMLARNSELEFDDVTKIIGCWNGLVKRKSHSNETLGNPMKRAIAFTGTIRDSKLITNMFSEVVDHYINESGDQKEAFRVEIDHADGSMNALEKNKKIAWLKADVPDHTCRILSNARFLTEGVDVPDLDAVMFLKPRKSQIDIAQAVGRVMRKAEGKDYGYVILPIGIPADVNPNSVLDNNEKYRVVWEVLNALRSLDERFDATINKLELNKDKPINIQVIGVTNSPPEGGLLINHGIEQLEFTLTEEEWSELERAIYGKIVKKVGNVRYWEDWSKDVADIAKQHMMRIQVMLEDTNSEAYKAFQKFVSGLRHNINGAISEQQAIEMLAQHLITKPVFEALFDSYSFAKDNPVSRSMDEVLKVMDEKGLVKEQKRLEDFYESVRVRAEGIDNLKAKQDIIIQLYDKFFKVGFKETTERLGIVFTPVEVVDFIIQSVEEVLKKHFGKSIGDEGVHILDPFTGTGTFIVRLLQSGLISKEDLLRKYTQELHANEIVLLSYYIAAINIEETFHSIIEGDYKPFKGIVLTDTFESTEKEDSFEDELFEENNERLERQRKEPIFAIIGNPPYSVGTKDENDQNKNQKYPKLDEDIGKTYAKYSRSKSIRGVYDSFVRAFRWATNRVGEKGVVGFITNSSYLDSTSTDGVRKCLYDEFNYIYVLNLRGAIRGRSGIDAKKEGQNVFDIMTGVAICILVKDGSDIHELRYHDIGDYLSRADKLKILSDYSSVAEIDWTLIQPDDNNDWLNKRDKNYKSFDSLLGDVFYSKVDGVQTNRDSWVYGFSEKDVAYQAMKLIENYNSERKRLIDYPSTEKIMHINTDNSFISWSRSLKNKLTSNKEIKYVPNKSVKSMYRPFVKKYLYYQRDILEYPRNFDGIFSSDNLIISVTGLGSKKEFSALMVDTIPNYDMIEKGRHFILNNNQDISSEIFKISSYNITDGFEKKLGLDKIDAFFYIYGVLHSKEYKTVYQNDLRKELPRIPIVKQKEKFVEVGRKLSELHLNYENVPIYDGVEIQSKLNPTYKVTKMKHPKKGMIDTIIFNNDITIKNIPEKAYEYNVNGKSAIQWIMEQYQLTVDSKTRIKDDPNDFSDDEKYIFDLLLRIINVSVQTVDLVNSLPALEMEE